LQSSIVVADLPSKEAVAVPTCASGPAHTGQYANPLPLSFTPGIDDTSIQFAEESVRVVPSLKVPMALS
jgi:hypothetical protein